MEQETYFAEAGRLDREQTRRQSAILRRDPMVNHLAGAVPDLIALLNRQRQVVYANRPFLQFLKRRSLDSVCGRRPGELLACVHSSETASGCGTSEGCRECGAARAILETQRTGKPSSQECTVAAGHGALARAYNFRVSTSRLEVEHDEYVLLSLKDISVEKHREVLQRIFFHDLLNTVSGLRMHLDLLRRQAEGEERQATILRLERIGDQLVEEIQSQKLIVSAEAGTLEVQKNLILSTHLAEELVGTFAHRESAEGRNLELAPFFESVSLISDEAILRRVLTNMIKNALEASPEGETVRLDCRRETGRVLFQVHNPGVMPPAVQRRVFHRFFTTKGQGRGLGTYSMKLLAEEYLRGRVHFESSSPEGTTFTVSLPGGMF
jgi:signal transduction histidine kinase